MLVLTRKQGERVLIGSTMAVRVRVLDIQGSRVKLGFECPQDVRVIEEELAPLFSNVTCEPVMCAGESTYHAEFA